MLSSAPYTGSVSKAVEVRPTPVLPTSYLRLFAAVILLVGVVAPAQQPRRPAGSSSSGASSSSAGSDGDDAPSSTVVRRRVDANGSAISLETSEPLFQVAAALNACGYDNGLSDSLPVRAAVRADLIAATALSADGSSTQRPLCEYVSSHLLSGAQNLAQYVSLSLFLGPAPELALSVPETEMPPDSLQVVEMLPLLREWSRAINLHGVFVRHRAEYEGAVLQVREVVSRMLLETNVYLQQPASSYDGRRFLVLLEPMLSPAAVNARVYGTDYFVVASPAVVGATETGKTSAGSRVTVAARAAGLQMNELRHTYLLYEIDPILYARSGATERLQPILKTVSDAPIDFLYKNDINAFTVQCLIRAIEARVMDVGFPAPPKPANGKQRVEIDGYNAALAAYEKRAEVERRKQVAVDMRSGWVLTETLYNNLSLEDRDGVSLKERIGDMVYGTDMNAEVNRAKKIEFYEAGSPELVRAGVTRGRAPRRTLSSMDQAEMRLQKGDRIGAETLAAKELETNPGSGEAMYVLARVKLMDGDPDAAYARFTQVLRASKDARTIAWSHVYLGRLYDTQRVPDRAKAVAEYRAALSSSAAQNDVKAAAEAGIKQAFAAPRRAAPESTSADDEELDPTGKKQKESYKPTEEKGAPVMPDASTNPSPASSPGKSR